MLSLNVRNVSEALHRGVRLLLKEGVESQSRNGPVLVMAEPVTTRYSHPLERVLRCPVRDANPFFHFFESLWMLAGRNDVKFLEQFTPRIASFSDDGRTLHGAYGARWRNQLGMDQLALIVKELRNSDTRRAVLSMWSPFYDLQRIGRSDITSKDVCCNTQVYFDRRGGTLNMLVCNRSNDIIWGAYGANAVHMSFLQEYVAGMLGVPVGWYEQMSFNYHLYPNNPGIDKLIAHYAVQEEVPELQLSASLHPLIEVSSCWDAELDIAFMSNFSMERTNDLSNRFFYETAAPMYRAWLLWKQKDVRAMDACLYIASEDWKQACHEWICRRMVAKKESVDA